MLSFVIFQKTKSFVSLTVSFTAFIMKLFKRLSQFQNSSKVLPHILNLETAQLCLSNKPNPTQSEFLENSWKHLASCPIQVRKNLIQFQKGFLWTGLKFYFNDTFSLNCHISWFCNFNIHVISILNVPVSTNIFHRIIPVELVHILKVDDIFSSYLCNPTSFAVF